jgi:hypothetical protein
LQKPADFLPQLPTDIPGPIISLNGFAPNYRDIYDIDFRSKSAMAKVGNAVSKLVWEFLNRQIVGFDFSQK